MFFDNATQTEVSVAKSWRTMLEACPVHNHAARQDRDRRNKLMLTIQRKKPKALIPPFSWILRMNMTSRLQLDKLGVCIWDLCDGNRSVEEIIDKFAEEFQLTFHEARVSVTNYIKDLMQRGALVLILDNQEVEI